MDKKEFLARVEEILDEDFDLNRFDALKQAFFEYSITKAGFHQGITADYTGFGYRTVRNYVKRYGTKAMIAPADVRIEEVPETEEEDTSNVAEFEPSGSFLKQVIENIRKATEVYHLRGLFNFDRVAFREPVVLGECLARISKFDTDLCSVNREAAIHLREDIEIFIENGCNIVDMKAKHKGKDKEAIPITPVKVETPKREFFSPFFPI